MVPFEKVDRDHKVCRGNDHITLRSDIDYMCSLFSLLQRFRRIWLLDRQGQAIASELRDDLGYWIRRRTKHSDATEEKAREALEECGVSEVDLRNEWALQRESQLSIRART